MLKRVDVKRANLEIPLEDFEELPRELGCSLHRHGAELTLATTEDNTLVFDVRDGVAELNLVRVTADPHGNFCRDVLGLLAQVYGGDLEAELHWQPERPNESRLSIVNGDTEHPLLFQAPVAEASVEDALADATRWWNEYLRLRPQAEPEPSVDLSKAPH